MQSAVLGLLFILSFSVKADSDQSRKTKDKMYAAEQKHWQEQYKGQEEREKIVSENYEKQQKENEKIEQLKIQIANSIECKIAKIEKDYCINQGWIQEQQDIIERENKKAELTGYVNAIKMRDAGQLTVRFQDTINQLTKNLSQLSEKKLNVDLCKIVKGNAMTALAKYTNDEIKNNYEKYCGEIALQNLIQNPSKITTPLPPNEAQLLQIKKMEDYLRSKNNKTQEMIKAMDNSLECQNSKLELAYCGHQALIQNQQYIINNEKKAAKISGFNNPRVMNSAASWILQSQDSIEYINSKYFKLNNKNLAIEYCQLQEGDPNIEAKNFNKEIEDNFLKFCGNLNNRDYKN